MKQKQKEEEEETERFVRRSISVGGEKQSGERFAGSNWIQS